VLWRLCVGDRKVCRVPFAPVRQPARNPSPHAAAWKARAFAALRADSSLSVRLRRYNEAMARARSLETVGGVQ